MSVVLTALFPGGILQIRDVLANGYWHARSPAFTGSGLMHTLEWLRLPADLVFLLLGAVPLVIATLYAYLMQRREPNVKDTRTRMNAENAEL